MSFIFLTCQYIFNIFNINIVSLYILQYKLLNKTCENVKVNSINIYIKFIKYVPK